MKVREFGTMFFMNGHGTELVNTAYVERLCIVRKPDAVLIVASYGTGETPITVGRYKDTETAEKELYALGQEIENEQLYCMGVSYSPTSENKAHSGYHGRKAKNHGGS